MNRSLCGVWRVASDKSDHLPCIANYVGSPIICNLYHSYDADNNYFKIEKKLFGKTQIIQLLCSYTGPDATGSGHAPVVVRSNHYQLGVLSVEASSAGSHSIMLTIVKNCDSEFTSFQLKRMGPGANATR